MEYQNQIQNIIQEKLFKNKQTEPIQHDIVNYNNNKYVVCLITYLNFNKLFIIDYDDIDKIIFLKWNLISQKYIGLGIWFNKNKDIIYLHDYIMNIYKQNNQEQIIDHINRIGQDNRKCNLRILLQTEYNYNQKQRTRKIILPIDSGLTIDNIPKNVYYNKQQGYNGEYFSIDITGIDINGIKQIKWKSTKSKKISLKEKLQLTINKLYELRKQYPTLQNIIKTKESEEQRRQQINEFNNILKLSNFQQQIIDDNIVIFQNELYTQIIFDE